MNRPTIATLALLLAYGCAAPDGTPASSIQPSSIRPSSSSTPSTAPVPSAGDSAILAKIATADGPIILAATDDTIWVENHRSNFVSRIDPAQNLEVERLQEAKVHCGIAAGAGYVWATQAAASSAKKIDAETGEVVDSLFLSAACGVAADDTDVWISSPELGVLNRYDPATFEERASITIGRGLGPIAIAPGAVWVGTEGEGGAIHRIDPATNEVVASVSTPGMPAPVFGLGAVWSTDRESRTVSRIDPATNTVAATIKMPSAIGGLGIGLAAVWTTGFGDGKVYRIDPATNQISGVVGTGLGNLGPPIFAFDSIWVAALDRNTVVRIDPAVLP